MNVILIDKSDPDSAAAVEGCEVGKPKTLTITVTPVADDEGSLVGTFTGTDVTYTEDEAPAEEEPAEETPAPASEKPYKPKAAAY